MLGDLDTFQTTTATTACMDSLGGAEGERMAEGADERRVSELVEAVRHLTAVTERVAHSLASLEALYTDALRKQDEDRAETKERQKKYDEEHEEFKERQKRWDERDKKWDEQGLMKNPWLWPGQIAHLLLMLALVVLAVVVFKQVSH